MPALLALFIRSLRDDARSKAFLWGRTGMAVAVLFAILKERVGRFSNASGLDFFESLVWMNVVFIAVAGLSYFASAITEEKEEGTLGLLRMTDLNPLAILLGKSTSRFVGGALMLLVQLPFAMLAITLGGVDIAQVFGSYAILLAMLFFACNAGLMASVIAARTGQAGVLSAVLMFVWGLAMYGADEAATSLQGGSFSTAMAAGESVWMRPCAEDPFEALSELFSVSGATYPFAGQCLWLVLGGFVCFGAALGLFNRFCTEVGGANMDALKKPVAAAAPARRNSAPPRRANGDAIIWRDFRFLHGGAVVMAVKLAVYTLSMIIFAADRSAGRFGGMFFFGTLLFLSITVIALESAFAASRIYRVERKDRTLGALLTLPRDLDQIIRAKRTAVLISLIPALIVLGIACLGLLPEILQAAASEGSVFFHLGFAIGLLIAQFYFNLRLVAWFSLRMKWGGLPTALALSWVGNSIVTFFIAMMFQEAALIVLIVITVAASVKMKSALRRRIAEAAAEE